MAIQLVQPLDLFWEAAKGKNGITVSTFSVRTDNPPANTWVVGGPLGSGMAGTLYPYDATPGVISVVSSSPNDNVSGIGARTVRLLGGSQPDNLTLLEVITLNGTTPVLSTSVFNNLNTFTRVLSVGSNGYPVGNLTFTMSGTVVHKIRAGFNRDVVSGGRIPFDANSFFFDQSYWADRRTEFRFQIAPKGTLLFIDQDELIVDGPGDGKTSSFGRAPVRVDEAVQTIVRAENPNTTIIISARAVRIPLDLLN